jgi:hypothetical protein
MINVNQVATVGQWAIREGDFNIFSTYLVDSNTVLLGYSNSSEMIAIHMTNKELKTYHYDGSLLAGLTSIENQGNDLLLCLMI